ncbi:helix-turn-helix domain-containing protein [Georgenia phoenicis]|uniref:helix-turn-helix domain-containing protein n=1 Tax=unclassified Georgenia TaxID=2626815 RepID=UPI0039AF4658
MLPTTYLSTADVAATTGTTPQTVRTWINSGNLEAVRVGPRQWRVPAEALEAFLGTRSQLDVYIDRVVDSWPELTVTQKDKLVTILRREQEVAR